MTRMELADNTCKKGDNEKGKSPKDSQKISILHSTNIFITHPRLHNLHGTDGMGVATTGRPDAALDRQPPCPNVPNHYLAGMAPTNDQGNFRGMKSRS